MGSSLTQQQVSVEDLHGDFCLFMAYVWQFLELPPPTPKQMEMAKWLEEGNEKGRQILMAFRGIGKSWITCTFVVWCLWRNPEEKVLVISASGARAVAFSIMAQRLITEIHFLRHLKPTTRQEQHRWSKVEFDVAPARAAQAPSVKSVGVDGQKTGSRATLIICDDVEVPKNSATVEAREKLVDNIMEVEAIILPEGRVVFLGTPQTEESVYKTLREKGYETRIWPALVPLVSKIDSYHGCLAPSIAKYIGTPREGRATDTRFTTEDLNQRESFWGRSGFALQFMLDTSLSDAERYPLKTGDLVVADYVDPEHGPTLVHWSRQKVDTSLGCVGFSGDRWYQAPPPPSDILYKPYEGRVMFIDPSGRGSVECVAVVIYQLHGKLFLADLMATKDGYGDETLEGFAMMAKRHKVNTVISEANFGRHNCRIKTH